jgi:hypothetical protein
MFQPGHLRGEVCLETRGIPERSPYFATSSRCDRRMHFSILFPLPRYGPDVRSVRSMSPSEVRLECAGRLSAGGRGSVLSPGAKELCLAGGRGSAAPGALAARRSNRARLTNPKPQRSRLYAAPLPESARAFALPAPGMSALRQCAHMLETRFCGAGVTACRAGLKGEERCRVSQMKS